MELEGLLERVKAATGPDRELDAAIAYATKFRPDKKHDPLGSFAHHEAKHDYGTSWLAHTPWHETWDIPAYTASFDAALALAARVLPGVMVDLGSHSGTGEQWNARLTGDSFCRREVGNTPALAILAAALAALVANEVQP